MSFDANGRTVRGTSNGNSAGSAETRRRRRSWLVETYRADVDVVEEFGEVVATAPVGGESLAGAVWVKACRCYRCGRLLTAASLTVDRIIPGCKGGTYRRGNIRPACGPCNSLTGGSVRS